MDLSTGTDALGELFAYPSERSLGALRVALAWTESTPDAHSALSRFADAAAPLTLEELQELYTRTFDLNPVCSLEVGWQLYGENYTRGEFLVEMRQTLRRLGVPETCELPDHLTTSLRALGRMDPAEGTRFAARRLLPALDKMVQGLRGSDCPYEWLLNATHAIVTSPLGAALEKEVCHA